MMLPSKKILSFLILTTALVGSIIIGFGRDKGSKPINLAQNLVAGDKISVPGNPNWQNELGQATDTVPPLTTPESEEQNTTDAVSIAITSNYMALKQSGKLDQTSAQKLVDQTLNYVSQTNNQITRISELNVIPNNGIRSIAEYGENLGIILKTSKPQTVKNEVQIITIAIESKDQSKIDELDEIIAVYEALTLKLKKMPVPEIFVKAHLDMVNGVMGMALALKEIKVVFGDPLKGLSALQLYKEGATIFTQSIKATRIFINQNSIIYKQGSGGYYLLYGI